MRLLEPDVGEALDRLSILSLKIHAAAASAGAISIDSFQKEADALAAYVANRPPVDTDRYAQLRDSLDQTNARLWILEDLIRQHRAIPAPHDDTWRLKLADIALEISERNDTRAQIVAEINALFGQTTQEKIYAQAASASSQPQQQHRPFPSSKQRIAPGEALLLAERYEEAIPFIEQQYMSEPEDSFRMGEILSNLGICYRVCGRLKDSNNAYARAIMRDPSNATIWGNSSLTMTDMGEHTAAFKAATNAYRLKPNDQDVAFIYTTALLREGRWTEAWPIWDWCRPRLFKHGEVFTEAERMREWQGEDFPAGSRFLVIGEWGFGDGFMMLRYLGLLKERGAHVTYASWKRQTPVFEGHQWIDKVHTYVSKGETPPKLTTADFDYSVCIMDLPSRFGSTPATVPHPEAYLTVDSASLDGNRLPATRKRRIGICWQAEESAYSHRFRSYRDNDIAPLESVGAEWYSLLPGQSLPWMHPHAPSSWRDSADLVSQLDLVITVDTAVAHLAGAMGKPTWLLLPAGSSWQWLLDRPTSVWYRSMRLLRSDEPDDFLAIPEQVARELR